MLHYTEQDGYGSRWNLMRYLVVADIHSNMEAEGKRHIALLDALRNRLSTVETL